MKQMSLIISFYFFTFMTISCQSNAQTYTIETNLGNIQVKLYEQTPLHKENFEKLVAEQFYDSVSFHRIIAGFMIQTGNPATKPVSDVDSLRNALNYTIEAEFVPEYFHKKGALAAARTGDAVNPEKRSSSSQFYIVQGRTYTDGELNQIEEGLHIEYSEFQRGIYKTLGGTPFLDGNYTVFGEVVKGLEVVDAIASVQTGPGDVPVTDVRILRIVKD
jgi:peptidyl-prolyl cis-trans isomerase B (cyclophilin B)